MIKGTTHCTILAVCMTAVFAAVLGAGGDGGEDPKIVMQGYVRAIGSDDSVALKGCFETASKEEELVVASYCKLVAAERNLMKVAVTTFPQQREGLPSDLEHLTKTVLDEISAGIANGKASVEGDTASLAIRIEDSNETVRLVRRGGQWKIDTAAYFNISGAVTTEVAKRIQKRDHQITALASKISDEITSHQFKSLDDAMNKFVEARDEVELGDDEAATTRKSPDDHRPTEAGPATK